MVLGAFQETSLGAPIFTLAGGQNGTDSGSGGESEKLACVNAGPLGQYPTPSNRDDDPLAYTGLYLPSSSVLATCPHGLPSSRL
jgi:hypothetical protein